MRRIEQEVRREAKRQIIRHETRARLIAEERLRRLGRSTALPALPQLSRPHEWSLDIGFDPYLTRSRAERIAYSIRAAFIDRRYVPRPPCLRDKSKPSGGKRPICVYQVADSAVSKMLFESLMKKNLPLMSARSYAYRKDVSTQDAIRFVKSELVGEPRMYVAEYDFSKYFETIEHRHINRILERYFFLADLEWEAIQGFLITGGHPIHSYSASRAEKRDRGIPQGTSISLFLANVAAWELDRELERHGVGFARYADDTLIWSKDYGSISAAADVLHEQAKVIGVAVNSTKSPGIHLLVPDGVEGEISSTSKVDYLGYQIRTDGVHLKPEARTRMKSRIDRLVYNTLLREPLQGTQEPSRLALNVDRDYVVLISRIRRHLYGDLSERELRRCKRHGAPLRRFKGVMAAYPLLDDTEGLAELDRWILNRVWLALRKRALLLERANSNAVARGDAPPFIEPLPPPHDVPRRDLRTLAVRSQKTGQKIDLSVPSVRRIARIVMAS
jgi:RNA-directed DNA polymerase